MSGLERDGRDWRQQLIWQLPLLMLVCYLTHAASDRLDEDLGRLMPETAINCSTHNSKESGYKALFELCRRVGLDCRRFESPYRDLPGEKAVLVIVAPDYPLKKFEEDHVLKWVAAGNKLVYLDNFMYGAAQRLLGRLHLKATGARSVGDAVLESPDDIPEMQHVSQLVLSAETRLSGGRTILADERGALLVEVNYGRGRCLLGSVPNLCANRRICEKDNWGNFQFMVNWLKSCRAPVAFDERVHGYTSAQNVFIYLARSPMGLVVLQLFIVFCLALLSLNQRFGPARPVPVRRKIVTSEFIGGMARTYQKARAYDAAFSILYGSFRTRLCRALGLSPREKIEEIARSWSQTAQLSYEETSRFLQTAEELQAQKCPSEERLLTTMKECDRLHCLSKTYLSAGSMRRTGS